MEPFLEHIYSHDEYDDKSDAHNVYFCQNNVNETSS